MVSNLSRMQLCALFVLLVGMFGFSGCASYSTAHTATPIEKGQVETSVRASYYGLQAGSGNTGALRGGLPSFEFAGRYGVSKNVDVGAKVFPIGIGLDANIAVINQEAFAFSVNPAVSYVSIGNAGGTGGGYGMAFTNLLADVVKTENFTLTTGLKPGLFYSYGSAQGQFGGAATFGLGGLASGLTTLLPPSLITVTLCMMACALASLWFMALRGRESDAALEARGAT